MPHILHYLVSLFREQASKAQPHGPHETRQMDPEEKEKMEKRDWLAEKIQMLNTQLEGFEADVEKAVSHVCFGSCPQSSQSS